MDDIKIEVGGLYKTHVGDLVKIMEIKEKEDTVHLYNISESANQWVSLSKAKEFKFRSRIR
jgi:mRNA-degrading endonuclease RelE of RelBE toxin-antitoxin system